MKKIIVILLLLIFTLSLTACSSEDWDQLFGQLFDGNSTAPDNGNGGTTNSDNTTNNTTEKPTTTKKPTTTTSTTSKATTADWMKNYRSKQIINDNTFQKTTGISRCALVYF